MKTTVVAFIFVAALCASAQDKPRVFVQGKGSENINSNGSGGGGHHWGTWGARSTVDSHDESMEVTKDLQKDCSGVIVTMNQANADYVLVLNRESKQNRGLFKTNSQVQVANRAGDILGTNATHTVGNAAKDACQMITSDWAAHGSKSAATAAVAPELKAPAAQPNAPVQPAVSAAGTVAPEAVARPTTATQAAESAADAAKREKQRQTCLELAKDNSAITCK